MERASFDASDPAVLVEALLACPLCLHAVDWSPLGWGSQPTVVCRCRECSHTRNVELSGLQLLRLATLDDHEVISWSPLVT